ncbi:MAG: hypothetical protein VW397_08470 [Candidatus Margulisiibacteriota bacterium]
MDQLKTRILSFRNKINNQSASLVIYLRLNDIVAYQMTENNQTVNVAFELIQSIDDTLISALDSLLKTLLGHKLFNPKAQVMMVIDDHYLTMHRFHFSKSQVLNLHESLDIEIDQLSDYFYAVSFGPSDYPDLEMVLAYLIKKSTLIGIESVFENNKLRLTSMVSRYHGFQFLFNNNVFDIEPKQTAVILDISQTRVRLYVILNNQIKVYRRMIIRIDENQSKLKVLDSVLDSISDFVESSIDSYLNKFTNQSIETIYCISDVVILDTNLKKRKIKRFKLDLLPVKDSFFSFDIVERKVTFLFAYAKHFMDRSFRSFNLIPIQTRFERRVIKYTITIFLIMLLLFSGFYVYKYKILKDQYDSFLNNRSQQVKSNAQKRREMVELRNRIQQQQKIIDFSDLTTKVFNSAVNIDDLLYQLVSITTPDMSFKVLQIRGERVDISGTSSSVNGNYSFYIFLQKLENFPNFDRVRYNLGMGAGANRATFYVEFYLKKK